MEQTDKYKIKEGEEATPIIVLTGTLQEFEEFCSMTKRNTKTAVAIRQPFQLELYPDLEIVLYGQHWLNQAFDSPQYKERMFHIKLRELENNNG